MTDARSPDDFRQAARRHWRQVALSTEPIDKASAARAVEALYRTATGRPPATVLFFDSPLEAEIAATFLNFNDPQQPLRRTRGRPHVARIVGESIGMNAFGALPNGLAEYDVHQLESPVRAALDVAYRTSPDRAVFKRAFHALCSQLPSAARNVLVVPWPRHKGWLRRVKLGAERSVRLRLWMAWAAHHSFLKAIFPNLRIRGDEGLISAVTDVCEECGSCWFYPDIAIVSDRPAAVRLDAAGRLHAEDGPALGYRDGFSIHALHGVHVERWVIERPSRITAADVEKERNTEVRRALVERIGYQRYLSLSGAAPISRDDTGTLWRVNLPIHRGQGQRAWCLVEVVNGTREPDGSHKRYFLRVPPTMREAREAVAWTYGLSAETYQPLIRT